MDPKPYLPAALALTGVSCTFVSRDAPGQRYTAVADVTLKVGAGEFVSVVGPTGCGKSTLLNLAAWLLAPSSGSVEVFGQQLPGINARATLFQGESLMPWRTALQNVRAGFELRGVAMADATARRLAQARRPRRLRRLRQPLPAPALGWHEEAHQPGADAGA